jgi:hypothetical protein
MYYTKKRLWPTPTTSRLWNHSLLHFTNSQFTPHTSVIVTTYMNSVSKPFWTFNFYDEVTSGTKTKQSNRCSFTRQNLSSEHKSSYTRCLTLTRASNCPCRPFTIPWLGLHVHCLHLNLGTFSTRSGFYEILAIGYFGLHSQAVQVRYDWNACHVQQMFSFSHLLNI